jgi:hypothetical protein
LRTPVTLFAGCLAILAAELSPGTAAPMSPLQMIQNAYSNITQDKWTGISDPEEVGLAPAQLTASWFTPKFIAALKRNASCYANGGEGRVVSVWYNGQDYAISQLKITSVNGAGNSQTIRAEFLNAGHAEKHDYVFKNSSNAALIDDVIVNGQSSYALMMKGCAPK